MTQSARICSASRCCGVGSSLSDFDSESREWGGIEARSFEPASPAVDATEPSSGRPELAWSVVAGFSVPSAFSASPSFESASSFSPSGL